MGGKVQGIRSINGRYKIDRGLLRVVWEMEKPKNLYVQPMDMNQGQGMLEGVGGAGWKGIKGRKKWDNCYSIINKIYFLKINKYTSLKKKKKK